MAGRHRRADVVQAAEAVIPGRLKQQQKGENDAPGINVRHDEKEHARPARLQLFMLETDQEEGGQRHQFPGDEKDPDVVRHEQQRRGQQHRVVESAHRADILAPEETPGITERINRNRHPKQRDDHQEKRAQRVQPHRELQAGDERADARDQRRQQIQRPIGVGGRAGQKQKPRQKPAQRGERRHAEAESRRQFLAAQEQQPPQRSEGIPAERHEEQRGGG